ncbi:MAG: Smr/MutS family protein [Spirochaetaceae bacterium]|jgi:DNA mismatch repair protein MutS2|nr:Smr/MutS family protein [Spirochaetaceae bacterium]
MPDPKISELLEFDAIVQAVAGFSRSFEAQEMLQKDQPLYEVSAAENLKYDVREIVKRIIKSKDEADCVLPPLAQILSKLKVAGVCLSIEEAFAIALFIKNGKSLLRKLDGESTFVPKSFFCDDLCGVYSGIDSAEEKIFSVIDKDGKLRDLPQLRVIKRRIAALIKELQNITSSFSANDDTRKMLQSDLPSQRDGRTVMAVKSNFRGKIRGIVRDVSQGGATIFIEPEQVVEKNNELFIEERALDAEIRKILRELTENIAPHVSELLVFHSYLLRLECICARARYSIHTKGIFAKEDGETLNLVNAKHPLLGEKAVPIDLCANKLSLVLITGPNTGGKTVALKTVGLFALMNQWGLAVPASPETTLPVFNGIFADIGDEQSISESLSTFSAHINNIAGIIQSTVHNSGGSTLVLFDELCSGTDPAEGSALAMAIIDRLIESKCRLIVTTHHGVLKNYALGRMDAANASVDFDVSTLSPCYRIVMGIPGESRALDIALRYGLDSAIVDEARRYISDGLSDISALITTLTEKIKQADTREKDYNDKMRIFGDEKLKTDLKELRLRQKEAEIKSGSIGSMRAFLSESRKTLENLVRELKEQNADNISRDQTLKVKDFIANLTLSIDEEDKKLDVFNAETKLKENNPPENTENLVNCVNQTLYEGQEVLTGNKKLKGILRRKLKKGMWLVDVGSVSISAAEDSIFPVLCAAPEKKPVTVTLDFSPDKSPAVLELNIRGMRLDDAMDALQSQIDAAQISGLSAFAVIHGKGDGILQEGVHRFLKKQAVVQDYYFSRPELGGFGRTEVLLKV